METPGHRAIERDKIAGAKQQNPSSKPGRSGWYPTIVEQSRGECKHETDCRRPVWSQSNTVKVDRRGFEESLDEILQPGEHLTEPGSCQAALLEDYHSNSKAL